MRTKILAVLLVWIAASSAWARSLREARAAYSTGPHDSSGAILDEQREDRA